MYDWKYDYDVPWYNYRTEIKTVTLPEELTSIGETAFGSCIRLTDLTIPNSVTSIGDVAFLYCWSMRYIHIPSNVTSIGFGIVAPDSAKANFIDWVENMTDEEFAEEVGTSGLTREEVASWPKTTLICSDSEDAYAKTYAEQNGNEFAVCNGHDGETPDAPETPDLITGTCGDNLTWTLDTVTGELVISGTGYMYGWSSDTDVPWYEYRSSIKTVTISDGVKNIWRYAFSDCINLRNVTIPDSVTSIGDEAFFNCHSLEDLTLGSGVEKIGRGAFNACAKLKNVIIPNSVTSISDSAFNWCYSLEYIHIPSSVTEIGDSVVMSDKDKTGMIEAIKNLNDEEFAVSAEGTGITREDVESWPLTTLICSDSEDAYAKTYAEQNGNEFKACGGDHRKEFTVTLNIDGVQSVITLKEGDAISIESPVKEGHTFVEWTPAMPETMPAENLEFTAVFEVNSYTVIWVIDGMTISETHKFGDLMDQSKSFEKKGYTFIGWTPEIPETMPAHDLEFTAIFEINICDAVFNANGGAFPDGDSVKRIPTVQNAEIVAPQDPERAGYQFAGWAYNGKNIGTEVGIMDSTEGKIFDAVWIPNEKTTYKVETYTMNTYGEYEVSFMIVKAFVSEEVSVDYTVSEGFEINEEKSVLSGTVTSEETLVLKVYIDRKQYKFTTVVFDTETTVLYYSGAIVTSPDWPLVDGYVFQYWEPSVPVIMPAHDVTVTAKFRETTPKPRIEMVTPEKRTIYYGESITLQVRTYNLPDGAKVKWEVSGDGVSIKPSSSGKTCKVTSTSNGNVVIKAYVVDSKGNTISGKDGKPVCDSEYLYSEVNLWQVIVNFFKQLLGLNDSASQTFKGIF